ncbi:MAG: hypothetical protein R3338_10600 [Thermoanaerobaculia bacterium]|nr:hypothetical protein [Thermoanaerobaculia bacterium]
MHGYVTSVDWEWYSTVRSIAEVDETNLWRPGIRQQFRALDPGEPVFFRLKSPRDRIAGFGFFTHFSIFPVSLAWRIFTKRTGASSRRELHDRVLQLRSQLGMETEPADLSDPDLGCILLRNCIMLDNEDWLDPPEDFDDRAGHGKLYDLSIGEGKRLWSSACRQASDIAVDPESARSSLLSTARYGPRSFRVAVFDAWGRRCAVTGEGVATALDAARFAPDIPGAYSLSNGILLRADLAYLLEAGYITITPDHVLRVSSSVQQSETGRDYHRWHGTGIRLPEDPSIRPDPELLWLHQKKQFIG